MTVEGIRVSRGWLALREPPTPRPARPTSSSTSRDTSRRPAAG